jgi:hypothetical protein
MDIYLLDFGKGYYNPSLAGGRSITAYLSALSPERAHKAGKQSVSVMHGKSLVSDSRANASFAFAAVFILMAVTASGLVVPNRDSSAAVASSSEGESDSISAIERVLSNELGIVINGAASKAFASMKQPFDMMAFEGSVRQNIIEHFARSYPARIDSYTLDAKPLNISIGFSPKCDSRHPNASVAGGLSVSVQLAVMATSSTISYETVIDYSDEIENPIPFLSSRLENIEECATTEGKIGRIVRSVLTQLVQLRVLQGIASPANSFHGGLGELLSAEDVEFAVNFALLLVEVSNFGSADGLSWNELLERASGRLSINSSSDWFAGEVDPFKTLLLLKDREAGSGVNLRDFSLQLLYSMVDRLVVRFLEYSHMIDLANCALDVRKSLDNGWHDFVEFMTGIDSKYEQMIDRISDILSESGVPECAWSRIFQGSQDASFNANASSVGIFDLTGKWTNVAIGSFPISIDIPELSIMNGSSWKGLTSALHDNTLSAGDVVEMVVLGACEKVALSIPQEYISGSMINGSQYLIDLLDALQGRLDSLNPESLGTSDPSPFIPPYNENIDSLNDFINENWVDIFPFAEAKRLGRLSLAQKLADTAVVSNPSSLRPDWKHEVMAVVLSQFNGSLKGWAQELDGQITGISETDKSLILLFIDPEQRLALPGSAPHHSISDWTKDGALTRELIAGMRSQIQILRLQIANMSNEFSIQELIEVVPSNGIRLIDDYDGQGGSNNSAATVFPRLTQSPAYLEKMEIPASTHTTVENVDSDGKLVLSIFSPDCSARNKPKSTHYTGTDVLSSFPYETNWMVRAKGSVKLVASDAFDPSMLTSRSICIDIDVPITAISGWPLNGVQYETSDNMIGDALELLGKVKNCIWEYISPFIEVSKGAFDMLKDALSDLSRYVIGFAEKVSEAFQKFADMLISVCGKILDKIRNSILWKFVKISLDMFGTVETRFHYGPATVIVSCSLPDLLFRKAKDLVRIIVVFNFEKMNVSMGFRIAELANKQLDIVVNSTLMVKGLKLELRLDPLMAIRDHLIEINGYWRDFRVQIWSPEVNDYKRFSVQLSDIPLLGPILSNIPIPELGISVSINAGLIVKYNLPICDSLVINEIELNPPSHDSGHEWVELYNPLGKEIPLGGYTIETMHGEIAIIELSGTMPAKGYRAFTFPHASLDNGQLSDTFAMGDSVMLRDPSGAAVDISPVLSDTNNDNRTWHRSWDGAPKWVFGSPSKAKSNGNALLHAYPDLLLKLCIDSLYLAIEDEMQNVSFSLDFVRNLITSFLKELIGQLADFAGSLLLEAVLFIDVGINDLSGTVGGGFRLRVSVDGELLRQAVIFFAEQICKLLGRALFNKEISPNLLKGSHPAEGIYVGFDIFGRIGIPRWLKSIFDFTRLPSELRIALSFSVSLATIAKLFGYNMGKICIKFGVHLDNLPGLSLVSPLSLHRDRVDLWLLKGTLTTTK